MYTPCGSVILSLWMPQRTVFAITCQPAISMQLEQFAHLYTQLKPKNENVWKAKQMGSYHCCIPPPKKVTNNSFHCASPQALPALLLSLCLLAKYKVDANLLFGWACTSKGRAGSLSRAERQGRSHV